MFDDHIFLTNVVERIISTKASFAHIVTRSVLVIHSRACAPKKGVVFDLSLALVCISHCLKPELYVEEYVV